MVQLLNSNNHYTVYWSAEFLSYISNDYNKSQLEVIYGGNCLKLPSINSVRTGDIIYPVTICNNNVYVMARLDVTDIISAEEYLKSIGFDSYYTTLFRKIRFYNDMEAVKETGLSFHKFPLESADKAAIGKGSKIRMRLIPNEYLKDIMLGKKDNEKLLKIKNNKVQSVNFSGNTRRISFKSVHIFESLF